MKFRYIDWQNLNYYFFSYSMSRPISLILINFSFLSTSFSIIWSFNLKSFERYVSLYNSSGLNNMDQGWFWELVNSSILFIAFKYHTFYRSFIIFRCKEQLAWRYIINNYRSIFLNIIHDILFVVIFILNWCFFSNISICI